MSVSIDGENQEVRGANHLRQSGNSTVVTIPPAILEAAGFEQGDKVSVTAQMDSTGRIVLSEAEDTQ